MTGGDSGSLLEGLAKAFQNPTSLDILPYRHNYTPDGTYVLTGYFIPAYSISTRPEHIDHRGYTDPVSCREFHLKERLKKAGDPKALLLYSAEYCFTPSEALALEGENRFNTEILADLVLLINLYKNGPKVETGTIEYSFKNNIHKEENVDRVVFKPNPNGKIHIIERPILDQDGNVPRNLYIAGIDGIDMGDEDTSVNTTDPSLFCVVIKKRIYGLQDPLYVCYYKDRPLTLKEAHRTCMMLLLYYNCQAVLESTRISILGYFRERKCENKYLMRRPRAALSNILKGISRLFGVLATPVVISHQLDLVSNYIDEYGHNIWFIEMLEELIRYSYSNKRKFDIVAAMGMAELGDEELMGIAPRDLDESSKVIPLIGYWVDYNGIKHRGIVPSMRDPELERKMKIGEFKNDYLGARTSSRRFDPEYISEEI